MNNKILGLVLAGIVVLSLLNVYLISKVNVDTEVTVPNTVLSDLDKAEIISGVLTGINSSGDVLVDDKLSILYDKLTDVEEESISENLVLDELKTRDFARVLMAHLNDNGASIENYRDIDNIVVKDISVDVNGEDADVELEFKVYYFNDGDDDEADIVRSKVEITLEVEKLVDNDDYEDAEVSNYNKSDLTFVKTYT